MDTVYVSENQVSCDGNGHDGHPKIYLFLDSDGQAICPYCNRKFIKK